LIIAYLYAADNYVVIKQIITTRRTGGLL